MKIPIKLRDNNYSGEDLGKDIDPDIERNLRFISDRTINKLSDKKGENLLVFPHCLNAKHKDIDGKDSIFSFRENKIYTSNYMGFIGKSGTEVFIGSRFDKGESNYFVHYMLQKVFAINLIDLKTSKNDDSIWDFLIYLFPYFLKRSLRQGLYKKYERREYNDAKVKGAINVARHLSHNIPFAGKVAYSTKEYSYDNHLTQLIRHTIEYINTHKLGGQKVLQSDSDCRQAVAQIVLATPSYSVSQRYKIIAKNIKPERHPFYTEYTFLQKLCLQILKREKISFGENNNNKVYGLIFDGAWLWEEYLNTILKQQNFKHPRNKENTGQIYLFTKDSKHNGIRYPDFYKESIVLDAKYKKYSDDTIDRNDLHQIVTYMHCLPAKTGGLIYPEKSSYECGVIEYGMLNGKGGKVYKIGMRIPDYSESEQFSSFCFNMISSENSFINKISSLNY